jgi:hypothetical protein
MFTPFSPFGQNPFGGSPIAQRKPEPKRDLPPVPPEQNLPRALNYYADYSGCGFWRMLWPEHLLNAYHKCVISGQTTMVLDPRYYHGMKTVRIQRQATANQLKFVEFLKEIQEKAGFKIVYEIDDIVFREDIPDYNKFKAAFTQDEIREASAKIMGLCDEVTVTNHFMRDYYKDKTGNDNITVIPNYPPKFWLGHYYNEEKIRHNFRHNKARPRILYAGSGAHFDVDRRVKLKDDFYHVVDAVIRTRSRFKWVFVGAFPAQVQEFIQRGEMEFHPWAPLFEYPKLISDLDISMCIAPLIDSNFNRAKSDIKHIEACAYGLPVALQDMVTYQNAPLKFKTGDEMVDLIARVCGDKKLYMAESKNAWDTIQNRWLENPNNLNKYLELYTLPYRHEKRKLLNAIQDA